MNLRTNELKLNSFRSYLYAVIYALLFYHIFCCISFNHIERDIVVISATYFTDEKSGYPNNTMTVLFNSPKRFNITKSFVCLSQNKTSDIRTTANIRYALEPNGVCEWSTFILTCPVVYDLISFSITDTDLRSSIPHRDAIKKPMGVVACFSPLFYNERWQLIIPTLEIYRQMGVDLQNFYVQSMLKEIYDFLKVYETLDIARIVPWNQLQLDKERIDALGYDPNTELEWRNQATTHTDCFIHYKQSAEFIIISDIDDILFPKLASNYLDEFKSVVSSFPWISSFAYSRYNTQVVSSLTNKDFSLSSLINSARISNQWEDGKYVVVPYRVESAWLHWPGVMERGYRFHIVDEKINIMVHFRNWTFVNNGSHRSSHLKKKFALFDNQISYFAPSNFTNLLDENFRTFLSKHVQKEFDALPKEIRYYPLIEKCYDKIFYSKAKVAEFCPGPLKCDLPRIKGVKCVVAKRRYKHEILNSRLKFHVPISNSYFVTSNDGCFM